MSNIRILLCHYRTFPTKSRMCFVCDKIFGCDLTTLDANAIFLRKLRSVGLTIQVMLNFYRAVFESVWIFSITVWFGLITQKETLRLNIIVKTASRIIGGDLHSLEILYQQRLLGRATLISQDSSHPAHDLFEPLPSGRRFRSIKTRTNLFSTSFSPLPGQALSKQK